MWPRLDNRRIIRIYLQITLRIRAKRRTKSFGVEETSPRKKKWTPAKFFLHSSPAAHMFDFLAKFHWPTLTFDHFRHTHFNPLRSGATALGRRCFSGHFFPRFSSVFFPPTRDKTWPSKRTTRWWLKNLSRSGWGEKRRKKIVFTLTKLSIFLSALSERDGRSKHKKYMLQ